MQVTISPAVTIPTLFPQHTVTSRLVLGSIDLQHADFSTYMAEKMLKKLTCTLKFLRQSHPVVINMHASATMPLK